MLEFIDSRIASVDQLEILLLLQAQPARSWTATEVSSELRGSEQAVADRLSAMHAMGLFALSADGRYHFAPTDPENHRVVAKLADSYRQYRLRVIERIFTKSDGLSAFADAFRFRRGP